MMSRLWSSLCSLLSSRQSFHSANETCLVSRRPCFVTTVLAAWVVLNAVPNQARASFYLETNLRPIFGSENTGVNDLGGTFAGEGSLNKTDSTGYDLQSVIGWAFWDKMIIGARYDLLSESSKRGASADFNSSERKTDGKELGFTIGYRTGGWRFHYSHLLSGDRKMNQKSADFSGAVVQDYEIKQKLSGGFAVTVGYSFNVASFLQIGPTLTYRQGEYNQQSLANRLNSSDDYVDKKFASKAVVSELLPYVSAVISF